jgi:hypothetical protein
VTNTLVAVTVPTALNVSTLGELMSSIRSQHGRYHWASVTGATDLVFSGFVEHTDVNIVRVPYRDSVLALNDLSEARIEVFLSGLATVLPQIAGGKIKLLALTTSARPRCRMFLPLRKPGFLHCSTTDSSACSRIPKCPSNFVTGSLGTCEPSSPTLQSRHESPQPARSSARARRRNSRTRSRSSGRASHGLRERRMCD